MRATVGGRAAPLLYIGPGQINAQAPVDVAPARRMVVLENGNGASPAFAVDVAPAAPAVFVAVKNRQSF